MKMLQSGSLADPSDDRDQNRSSTPAAQTITLEAETTPVMQYCYIEPRYRRRLLFATFYLLLITCRCLNALTH